MVMLLQVAERTTSSWWGIVVPALVFIIAFGVTLLLYRHFSGGH